MRMGMETRELVERLTEQRNYAKVNMQLGMYIRLAEIDNILEQLNYLEQLLYGQGD